MQSGSKSEYARRKNSFAPSQVILRALGARRLAVLLLLLAPTLLGAPVAPVFPLKASADGRYLIDQRGQPFFYHADTAWTITVNLDRLREAITARWFDPTSGSYQTIAGVSGRGKQQFTPPEKNSAGAGDFVLVLEGANNK